MIIKRVFIIYLINFFNFYWLVNNEDFKNIVKDFGFGFFVIIILFNDLVEKNKFLIGVKSVYWGSMWGSMFDLFMDCVFMKIFSI